MLAKDYVRPCPHCDIEQVVSISKEYIDKIGDLGESIELAVLNKCGCEKARFDLKERRARKFNGFVMSDLVNFMELHEIEEINVKSKSGNKAKLKKDKNGYLNSETTIKEVM